MEDVNINLLSSDTKPEDSELFDNLSISLLSVLVTPQFFGTSLRL